MGAGRCPLPSMPLPACPPTDAAVKYFLAWKTGWPALPGQRAGVQPNPGKHPWGEALTPKASGSGGPASPPRLLSHLFQFLLFFFFYFLLSLSWRSIFSAAALVVFLLPS